MLLSICDNPNVLEVLRIIKIVIQIIKIIIPIILIISLSLDFTKAVYSNDNDLLTKAERSAIPKIVAALLVFFIPTFVDLIININSNENAYVSCLNNATREKIDEAYVKEAQILVDEAKESLSRSNFNLAVSKTNKLKNENEKNRILEELESILEEIEKKEEEERKSNISTVENGYWFPIGGSEIVEINGVKFAPGTPTATGLTAHFGGNDSVHQGLGGGHGAIDIGAARYSNVIASKSGTVTHPTANERIDYPESSIKPDANGKYNCSGLVANSVTIDHGDGTVTTYKHLYANTITVRAGDHVKQGQVIGLSGSSGCSTGPHLHFGISVNGKAVDPEKYVSAANPRP